MSSTKEEIIVRREIGAIPLLQALSLRVGIQAILRVHLRTHGNEKVSSVETIMALLFNVTCGRQPLYELEEWVLKMSACLCGGKNVASGTFTDDRFGRALDKLYAVDRASLMTEIVVRTVRTMKVDMNRIHNDSTTVKAYGKIPGTTRSGLTLKRGHSKDHRPDLKQLVYSLSISADGAVPIHYKAYPGNRNDDTTHIETWTMICRLAGRSDFLYAADCKVCTDKQLSYIVGNGGRVLTILPETWKENARFKESLRAGKKSRKIIWRRRIPGLYETKYETFSIFDGKHKTQKRDYTLHWIYSSEKKKRDRESREKSLRKAERELAALCCRLNTRTLKTKDAIETKVNSILADRGVKAFYHIEIIAVKERYRVQVGKGRPGPHTQYQTVEKSIYSLAWTRHQQALSREKKVDGVFPLLCTDKELTALAALKAYKYQPRLEKRFMQFKNIHNAAPLLFKKIERVEAMMFIFFLGLLLQAVIEREVRLRMKDNKIESIPVYPEHRLAYHPTTAKIFDRFEGLSKYQLKKGDTVIKEYTDPLTEIHKIILRLLQIPAETYWQ